ncbi:restriction endonuclease [Saccharibacillus sp. CPCC 101409]|uniref:restriction endonuclease n=1 Tax=Saccharibacillus sp. CPCC 101409 TaxID=3058041 RepID=UPI0026736E82|nr:restriction endonuclease [Saccharibacillus sp. CPCC 101409]MDO3411219.1 restriction endonuclease [Saccharibacillus sp. CPCC 101409]
MNLPQESFGWLGGGALPWIALGAALLLILVALRLAALRRRRIRRQLDPKRITLKDIDGMLDGSDFERYLHRLFTELGYEDVYKTNTSGDFGADLVFEDRYGARTVLQAKRYSVSNPVGLSAVQEVYGSMRVYGAQRAIVLTSGRYTGACRKLAAYNGVTLLDRDDLEEMIAAFKARRPEEAMELIESEPEEAPRVLEPKS